MENWSLLSFVIQFLVAMGLAHDHDRNPEQTQLLNLQYSIDIKTPEKIIGATFYSEERLLVYSSNILVIISLSNSSETLYKYLENFRPRKLVRGFTDSKLLLLSTGWHCIRQLDLSTRQISTFSGSCVQPGFADGHRLDSRFNAPSDLQRAGNQFYVADYNNDCIRRLWSNGYVKKLISIHSKPFELAGNLFVAVHNKIIQVKAQYNTYVQFVNEVNATSLESCSPDTLSMLFADKCLNLLPLSRDTSLNPATINGSFDGLLCKENLTFVTSFKSSNSTYSTMQLLAVDVQAATKHKPHTTQVSTTEFATSSTGGTTERQKASSTVKLLDYTTNQQITTSTATKSKEDINSTVSRVTSTRTEAITSISISQNDSTTSEFVTSSNFANSTTTTKATIIPLHNHAHKPFDHLPKSYTEGNQSWSVILPVVLAGLTIVAVVISLVCIVNKRYTRRMIDIGSTEGSGDDTEQNLLVNYSDVERDMTGRCVLRTDSGIDCQYYNGKTSNGHTQHSQYKNGHIHIGNCSNGTALTNGMAVPNGTSNSHAITEPIIDHTQL